MLINNTHQTDICCTLWSCTVLATSAHVIIFCTPHTPVGIHISSCHAACSSFLTSVIESSPIMRYWGIKLLTENRDSFKFIVDQTLHCAVKCRYRVVLLKVYNMLQCRNVYDDAMIRSVSGRSKCPCLGFILHLLNLFCFAWFICGNVWVYKARGTVNFGKFKSYDLGNLVTVYQWFFLTCYYWSTAKSKVFVRM